MLKASPCVYACPCHDRYVAKKWGMSATQLKSCYTAHGASQCCPRWSETRFLAWLHTHRHAVAHVLEPPANLGLLAGTLKQQSAAAPLRYFLGVQTSTTQLIAEHRLFIPRAAAAGVPLRGTFLWALVRDPRARALSFYTHKVAPTHVHKDQAFRDKEVLETVLNNDELHNGMVKRYSPLQATADGVTKALDFVGVTERFDESMLVLKHKLGLRLADMLYTSVKVSTERRPDNTGKQPTSNKPMHLWSAPVQRALAGKIFSSRNQEDTKLWQAANVSLNKEIGQIGLGVFNAELVEYRNHLNQVNLRCTPKKGVSFETLCCLYRDAGCGYPCIEQYVANTVANQTLVDATEVAVTAPHERRGSGKGSASKSLTNSLTDADNEATSAPNPGVEHELLRGLLTSRLARDPEGGLRPLQIAGRVLPGLSKELIDAAFLGQRVVFVGDSTSYYLAKWLVAIVDHTIPTRALNAMASMNLTDAYRLATGGGSTKTPFSRLRYESRSDRTLVAFLGVTGPGVKGCDYAKWWAKLRSLRPDVVFFNMGLHWLHFFGHTWHGATTKSNGPAPCAVKRWLSYETWIDQAVHAAASAGASMIFAKTTNFVCTSKYVGAFANAAAEFHSGSSTVRGRVLAQCQAGLRTAVSGLSAANASYYCTNGINDNTGANNLNRRLHVRVRTLVTQSRNRTGVGLGGPPVLALFNDSAIQSCPYTDVADGRHYHPLNLLRVRMLANLVALHRRA